MKLRFDIETLTAEITARAQAQGWTVRLEKRYDDGQHWSWHIEDRTMGLEVPVNAVEEGVLVIKIESGFFSKGEEEGRAAYRKMYPVLLTWMQELQTSHGADP